MKNSNKKNVYYSLVVNGREADIYIFGYIVEDWEKELWGFESDVSSLTLVNEVKDLDVDVINVHINSYGGIVSEGLAIYNTLKNHKAKVRTIVDGFAASAASVIFMAGEERLMNDASLMMIHQAWTRAVGNADDFRKLADDLDKITQGSIEAYKLRVNISEEKIWELIKAETWILPSEALEWGFATEIITPAETNQAAASAGKALINLVKNYRNAIAASGGIVFPKDKLNEILEEIRALKASHSTQNTQPASIQEPNPEPDSQPAPEPEPEPEPAPQENKLINFMAALFR